MALLVGSTSDSRNCTSYPNKDTALTPISFDVFGRLYLACVFVKRIEPRCTHRRVPGSRLVGAGAGDADVARYFLKIIFFVTLLATNSEKKRLNNKGTISFPKTRHFHIVITPIILLGRLLMRREYRSIIVSQVNQHNMSPP